MRHQFTILLGPTDSAILGKILTQVTRYAPLLEVKQVASNQTLKPKLHGKLLRHRVTDNDVKQMQHMAHNGSSVRQIAANIGCSEITIKRHVPELNITGMKL
jgi:DNA-binding NarL/FixJ family response regulator